MKLSKSPKSPGSGNNKSCKAVVNVPKIKDFKPLPSKQPQPGKKGLLNKPNKQRTGRRSPIEEEFPSISFQGAIETECEFSLAQNSEINVRYELG